MTDNDYKYTHLLGNAIIKTKTLEDYYNFKKAIETKAVKEFAERLKENAGAILDWEGFVSVDCIDDLVKEMDGEDK